MRDNKTLKILLNTIRIILGLSLLYFALIKALDPTGSSFEINEKLNIIFGTDKVRFISLILTVFLITVEFSIGVNLVFKFFPKITASATLILFLAYAPVSYFVAQANPYYSGVSCSPLNISNRQLFIFNMIFLLLAIILFFFKKKLKTNEKINERRQLSWLLTANMVLYFFLLINYSFAPIIDFSCYPKGTDLNKKIENYYLNTKKYHNYKVKLLYFNNKTKKFKYFSEKKIPWKDSNWIWINTKLIPHKYTRKGEITNFCIYNSLGRDITDSLLHLKEPVVFIVSYDLKNVNIRGFRKSLQFARKFRDQYFPVAYCLTSADQQTVDSIIELSGAYDIEFCYTNENFLRALVSSNPAIVILKDGVIISKRHYNLLPDLKKHNYYMTKIRKRK